MLASLGDERLSGYEIQPILGQLTGTIFVVGCRADVARDVASDQRRAAKRSQGDICCLAGNAFAVSTSALHKRR